MCSRWFVSILKRFFVLFSLLTSSTIYDELHSTGSQLEFRDHRRSSDRESLIFWLESIFIVSADCWWWWRSKNELGMFKLDSTKSVEKSNHIVDERAEGKQATWEHTTSINTRVWDEGRIKIRNKKFKQKLFWNVFENKISWFSYAIFWCSVPLPFVSVFSFYDEFLLLIQRLTLHTAQLLLDSSKNYRCSLSSCMCFIFWSRTSRDARDAPFHSLGSILQQYRRLLCSLGAVRETSFISRI